MAFSADGKTLATGYGSQPTRLWDVASGRELRRFQVCLASLTISLSRARTYRPMARPWPRRRTTGCYSGTRPRVSESRRGQVSTRTQTVTKLVKALRFAPDGESVATIGGHWIRIWDRGHGQGNPPDRDAERPSVAARGASQAADRRSRERRLSRRSHPTARSSRRRASKTARSACSTWLPVRRSPVLTGPAASRPWPSRPTARSWRRESRRAKELARDFSIRLWDVAAQRDLCRVQAHRSGISALAFSPDGRRLLSASADATALVWDVAALIGQENGARRRSCGRRNQEGVRRSRLFRRPMWPRAV